MLPFWVATGAFVAGFFLTGLTKNGAYGALAVIGWVLFVPAWALRRYGRIAKEAWNEGTSRWALAERELHEEHEARLREHADAESERKRNWHEFERDRLSSLRKLLDGDPQTVDEAIHAALEDLDFPFEAACAATAMNGNRVVVAVDLPEIEDVVPETRLRALKNGTVREVKRTQKERKADWTDLVLGISVQVARTVCAVAPSVRQVQVAGYTQRRQRNGSVADDWVFEVSFDRLFLFSLSPDSFAPAELLNSPEARLSPGNDGGLKKIPPPDWLSEVADDAA